MKKIYAIILFLFLVNSTYSQELGYVEGEVIVKFHSKYVDKSAVDDELLKEGQLKAFLTFDGMEKLKAKLSNYSNIEEWHCKKIFSNLKTNDTISMSRQGRPILMPKFWTIVTIVVPEQIKTGRIIEDLNSIGSPVVYAQANFSNYTLFDIPNDSEYGKQNSLNPTLYPYATINVEEAWGIETGESFVKIGVYDTGIDTTHPDLEIIDGQGIIANYYNWGKDNRGHGTSVSGIIGAKRNNGIGIAGIAGGNNTTEEGVSLVDFPYTQIGAYDFNVDFVCKGIVDGARKVGDYYQWDQAYTQEDHFSNYTSGHGIHAANHSWGIRIKPIIKKEEDDTLQKSDDEIIEYPYDFNLNAECPLCKEAMLFSYQSGVTNVVAAGNSVIVGDAHVDEDMFPQNMPYNWILKVGASSKNGDLLTIENNEETEGNYSSFWGDGMDIIAPGTKDLVYSTRRVIDNPDTLYRKFNGTSASAPHATGVVGLLMSYYNKPCYSNRNLSPDDVEYIITRSATDLQSSGYNDSTGWGRLNAFEALQLIKLPENQVIHVDSVVSSDIIKRDTILLEVRNAITDGHTINSQGPIGDEFPENFQVFKDYKIERVKVEQVLDFSEYIQSNTELIDFWVNRSACNSLDSLHDVDTTWLVIPGQPPYQTNKDIFDVNPTASVTEISGNQVTISGYYYYFIEGYALGEDEETLPIDYWYPANPSEAHMEISILIKDTLNPIEYDFPCYDDRPTTDTTMNTGFLNLENNLNIYPNPNKGKFFVEYESNGISKIVITNKLGQAIYSKEITPNAMNVREEIDLSKYSNGMYYISVEVRDSKEIKKIVKQ